MSVEKDSEAIVFAQVDANLDSNPKIRKAGSFGRQVFEFLLRRNALRGFKGSVPLAFVDPDYLADQLMISRDDAVTGVTKAVTANLLSFDDASVVRIVGWHESWGKRAKEGKERTREWRERKRSEPHEPVTASDIGDETTSRVTTGDKSDAREEKRRDQNPENTHRARTQERHPDAGPIARRVWDYAAKLGAELKLANVITPVWPLMAGGDHPGWQALLDRTCELLAGSDAAQAEMVARNRVDVAKAKAIADGDGNFFTPTGMFSPNSFAHWSTLDPKTIGRKRAGPRRAEGAAIGAASPRTDHPVSPTLIPISEL
jgi:hypothetical protein